MEAEVARRYRKLIESHFPELRIETMTSLLGGWDSDVIEVNSEFVFKFPRREVIREMIRKEIRLLPELVGRLSVRVPEPVFVDMETPLLGYRKVPGIPLNRAKLGDKELARRLADVIAEIHSFPVELAVDRGVPDSDWLDDFSAFYDWVRENALHLLDTRTRERAVRVWEAYLGTEHDFEPVLVHCDLSGDAHILCDPATNILSGIIDWGDCRIGDPAIDFTGLYWDCGEGFTRNVLDAYGGRRDEGLWERMLFHYWIGPFHEIRYGQETGSDLHVTNGVEALKEMLLGMERGRG